MTDHDDIVREALTSAMCGGGEEEQVAALAALDALEAERDEARRELRERDGTVERWQYAAETAEARAATLETALREILGQYEIHGRHLYEGTPETIIVPVFDRARAALAANTTAEEPA